MNADVHDIDAGGPPDDEQLDCTEPCSGTLHVDKFQPALSCDPSTTHAANVAQPLQGQGGT
eukprot:5612198-Prorocentrum_lima.AAC.1